MDNSAAREKTLADYYELGKRRMQVVQLREALKCFAVHRDYCDEKRCSCGLREALIIGTDARKACGLTDDRVTVCSSCPDHAERTADARGRGFDVVYDRCPACEKRLKMDDDIADLRQELEADRGE